MFHIQIYIVLAWEASAAQVTISYSRRLPDLNDFTCKLNLPDKSRPTQLRISKPSKKNFANY